MTTTPARPTMVDRVSGWWIERWVDVCLAIYYAGVVSVGLVGFNDPSISMTRLIGVGSIIYAVGMSSIGLAAIFSVFKGSRRSEAACLVAISFLTLIAGALVWYSSGDRGAQTGLRLAITPFGALPFAYLRAETQYLRRDVRRMARQADTDATEAL